MKIGEFWAEVRTVKASLPDGDILIRSIEDRSARRQGGVVSEVDRDSAAQRIVEGTHRLATACEQFTWRRRNAALKSIVPVVRFGTAVLEVPTDAQEKGGDG